MEWLETLYQQTQTSLGYDLGYDLFKIILGFIFAKVIYEKVIMKIRWGGREVIVKKDQKVLAHRELSPEVAKRIETDATDFSTYIKGVISPFVWLNIDVSSLEAKERGLVCKQGKVVTIDISKNPKKRPPPPTKIDDAIILDKLNAIMKHLTEQPESFTLSSGAKDKEQTK